MSEIGIEEFMKTATEEQLNILSEIAELGEEEQKHVDKINRIFASIESGIYTSDNGISLCEDEDDARVISMKPRQELMKVRQKLKGLMMLAVEKGMGNVGLIKRNHDHYVDEEWG